MYAGKSTLELISKLNPVFTIHGIFDALSNHKILKFETKMKASK